MADEPSEPNYGEIKSYPFVNAYIDGLLTKKAFIDDWKLFQREGDFRRKCGLAKQLEDNEIAAIGTTVKEGRHTPRETVMKIIQKVKGEAGVGLYQGKEGEEKTLFAHNLKESVIGFEAPEAGQPHTAYEGEYDAIIFGSLRDNEYHTLGINSFVIQKHEEDSTAHFIRFSLHTNATGEQPSLLIVGAYRLLTVIYSNIRSHPSNYNLFASSLIKGLGGGDPPNLRPTDEIWALNTTRHKDFPIPNHHTPLSKYLLKVFGEQIAAPKPTQSNDTRAGLAAEVLEKAGFELLIEKKNENSGRSDPYAEKRIRVGVKLKKEGGVKDSKSPVFEAIAESIGPPLGKEDKFNLLSYGQLFAGETHLQPLWEWVEAEEPFTPAVFVCFSFKYDPPTGEHDLPAREYFTIITHRSLAERIVAFIRSNPGEYIPFVRECLSNSNQATTFVIRCIVEEQSTWIVDADKLVKTTGFRNSDERYRVKFSDIERVGEKVK